MLEDQIKKEGILSNLICISNLLESEVQGVLNELSINHLEFSILVYISQNETTQYKIAKKYNTSIQRIYQVIKRLEKNEYISKREEICNGRLLKNLILNPVINKKIDNVNQEIVKKLKFKKITSRDVKNLNLSIEKLLDKLRSC